MPFTPDDDLIRRLPLPLAQLVRHAANAKTPFERCYAGFYVGEAALKLLGAAAVAVFAGRPVNDPKLEEKIQNLALPSLGDWRDLALSLLPEMANDSGFVGLAAFTSKKETGDLPRVAALDAVFRTMLDEKGGSPAAVRLDEFTLRIVRFRNKYIGHGRLDSQPQELLEKLGTVLLPGMCELLSRFDVLAGRALHYVAEIKKSVGDKFAIDRLLLQGESPRRLEPLLTGDAQSLNPEQIYFASMDGALTPAHPLLLFSVADDEVFFLNARRGETKSEYLGYLSGKSMKRADLEGDQRGLLGRILGKPIDAPDVQKWTIRPESDESIEAEGDTSGQWLGEFQLLSRLGRGGMGIVYRARQASLGREVALKKLLNPGDEKSEARFAREIRALGKVDHANLVRVYCSGVSGDDWYYAMELVEGATLANVIETLQSMGSSASGIAAETWRASLSTAYEATRKAEKPIGSGATNRPAPTVKSVDSPITSVNAVNQIVELVRQTALAAHALHESGILHRDIKPGNIMVTADGSKALLLDLGLAQLADEEHGSLTKTREFLGTLRYMSPEQLMDARKVDRRTDVYSLGATLWELLTLKPLFGATEETPKPEVIRRIQFDDAEPPRRFDKELSRDLEAVVLKSLEKNPAKRYQTANEFAEDLGRWQRGETVTLVRPSVLSRASRVLSRRAARLKQGLLLILTAVVIGLFILEANQRNTTSPGPSSLPPIKVTSPNDGINGKHDAAPNPRNAIKPSASAVKPPSAADKTEPLFGSESVPPAATDGLIVSEVVANLPAARAGIRQEMIVVAIDGKAIDSFEAWLKALTPGMHTLRVWDAEHKIYREIEVTKTDAALGVSVKKRGTPP
jgi:serine/threonine protein kinase